VSFTRLGRVAVLGVAVALLSGCAGATPGVAAQVGDDSITQDQLDTVTTNYCAAIEDQLTGGGQVVPMRFLRGGIARILANRSIGEQLAAEQDVEAGRNYDQQVAKLEQSASALGEAERDAVVTVETEQVYTQSIQAAVGRKLLEQEGAGADVAYSDTVARGKQAYADWADDNGVTFDPKLGVELVNGEVRPADTSLSFPVGEDAVAGSKPTPDPAYSEGLPASQRCG
jgi:peptidyl-prolyl cis-trans isomerase SurA